MHFDRVAILDWSAAKGPKLGKDSIWLGICDRDGTLAENIPTRALARDRLSGLVDAALSAGDRLLIGADFSFGFPAGFAQRVTGQPSALSVWSWLAARVHDMPGNASNYRTVAAQLNAHFPDLGPFWGNTARQEVPGLPRRKPPLPPSLAEFRQSDLVARESGARPKSVWQLAGVGAVGAQALTGLPVLHALRTDFARQISVWPFEEALTPVVLAEVYPSLLHTLVREASDDQVLDARQVTLLSRALFHLGQSGGLASLLRHNDLPTDVREEGWLLGAGHSAVLIGILRDHSPAGDSGFRGAYASGPR